MKLRLVSDHGGVVIDGSVIGDPGPSAAETIDAGAGAFHPGLINSHDHLHRNHYPRLGEPPYPNVYAWGDDLHSRFAGDIARARTLPRETALLFGALKNLLGGATTVVHHDRREPAFDGPFPIRVPPIRTAHSLRLDADLRGDENGAFAMHLAEGSDLQSAEELREAEEIGLLNERLLAVHVVGIDDRGLRRIRRSGAALVWCPTSNEFLYGRTAPDTLLRSGIDVLIGTDALVSGCGTLLDELAAARALGLLSDESLLAAVGSTAAKRLAIAPPALTPGSPADLVLFRRPVLESRPADVALVLVGGMPQIADESLAAVFDIAGVPCERMTVGGVSKLVAAPLAQAAREVFDLTPECARIVA